MPREEKLEKGTKYKIAPAKASTIPPPGAAPPLAPVQGDDLKEEALLYN